LLLTGASKGKRAYTGTDEQENYATDSHICTPVENFRKDRLNCKIRRHEGYERHDKANTENAATERFSTFRQGAGRTKKNVSHENIDDSNDTRILAEPAEGQF
jgi:hypothetical protein